MSEESKNRSVMSLIVGKLFDFAITKWIIPVVAIALVVWWKSGGTWLSDAHIVSCDWEPISKSEVHVKVRINNDSRIKGKINVVAEVQAIPNWIEFKTVWRQGIAKATAGGESVAIIKFERLPTMFPDWRYKVGIVGSWRKPGSPAEWTGPEVVGHYSQRELMDFKEWETATKPAGRP